MMENRPMEELTLHTAEGRDAIQNLDERELCLIPLLGTGISGMRVLTQRETVIGRQPGVDLQDCAHKRRAEDRGPG